MLSCHVETVVLLSQLKADEHIYIDVDTSELDLKHSSGTATYKQIQTYVQEKHGLKVSTLNISQVKRNHVLIERTNYNVGKGKARVPKIPSWA